MRSYRNGLGEWHHQHVENLLKSILWQGETANRRKSGPDLLTVLCQRFALQPAALLGVFDILTVSATASGASFHKTVDGAPTELNINWGGVERFEAGAEFEEYAAFANDPVIGSRWAQTIDEALLLTLAHELAHFVVALQASHQHEPPHGEAFRAAYAVIRRNAVNPLLDANAASSAQRAATRHEARLLRKIQALRKLAADASSNAHEAERALAQLQSLLAKHGLDDDAEAIAPQPHFIERSVPILRKGRYKPLTHYCFGIAAFCGVEAVIHTRRWRMSATAGQLPVSECITFFGALSDVEMAVYLSELLHYALETEEAAYRHSDRYRTERTRGQHPATLLASFRSAYTGRVNRRLLTSREAVENAWLTDQPEKKALVVARNRALQTAFAARYPRLGTHRSAASSAPAVPSAKQAGRRAADRVHLGKPDQIAANRRLEKLR